MIGRLDGFIFTPDASAAGSEAKALAGAAQKALAGEIDARAARLAQAADEQFVLATDGAIRWLGQPVGKLIAGEEVLKPRAAHHRRRAAHRRVARGRAGASRSLAQGPCREAARAAVPARRRRGHHRHRPRRRVPARRGARRARAPPRSPRRSRASISRRARRLRKYGVRFGAYHIYMPPLLKPAPRVLALQLWALKHGEPRRPPGSTRSSGSPPAAAPRSRPTRRSITALYRIAGYRVCGERAVRVDMLERLADIIRPALAWREGAPGVKPAAAFDGSGLHRRGRDDVADRLRRRGLRLDPALARLSDGEAAEAGGSGRAAAEASASESSESAMVPAGDRGTRQRAEAARSARPSSRRSGEPAERAGDRSCRQPRTGGLDPAGRRADGSAGARADRRCGAPGAGCCCCAGRGRREAEAEAAAADAESEPAGARAGDGAAATEPRQRLLPPKRRPTRGRRRRRRGDRWRGGRRSAVRGGLASGPRRRPAAPAPPAARPHARSASDSPDRDQPQPAVAAEAGAAAAGRRGGVRHRRGRGCGSAAARPQAARRNRHGRSDQDRPDQARENRPPQQGRPDQIAPTRIVPIAASVRRATGARSGRDAAATTAPSVIPSCGPSTSRVAARAGTAATRRRIRIRPLPSSRRSRSSSRPTPRSGASARPVSVGSAAHRQMALACAGGAHALRRGGAGGFRPCAGQRPAHRCRQPRGAVGRRGDGGARPRPCGCSRSWALPSAAAPPKARAPWWRI